MMRIALAAFFFLGSCIAGMGQSGYFISIQSDNNQPFYARIGEKTYPSTVIGHLVIPGLRDSTYRLAIGFPRNKFPEQDFSVMFNRKDLGYQLKFIEGQGWGLQNWETREMLRPRADQSAGNSALLYGERKKDDAFANLMAAVVNDSAVLYTTIVRAAPVKPQNVAAGTEVVVAAATTPVDTLKEQKTDSAKTIVAVVVPSDTVQVTKTIDTLLAKSSTGMPEEKPVEKKAAVTLLTEETAGEGKKLVFADSGAGKVDTISIVIPFEKDSTPAITKTVVPPDSPATQVVRKDTGVTTPVAGTSIPIDTVAGSTSNNTTSTVTKPITDSVQKSETAGDAEKKKLVLINSDCVNFATDYDVDKLRIKILAETNLDGRLAAAKKVLRTRCFTTKQFKALSELFMNDEERFRFFEAGYPYSADTGNFKQLVELLTDQNYIARFRSLVRMKD